MAYKRISPQPVVEGGIGTQTLTSHGVLVGNATGAVAVTTAGSTGTVLIGTTGSDPSFSASPSVTSITIANAPVAATDGTNKAYVDSVAAGLNILASVYAASTTTLNATYLNGASGVGATLTNAGAQLAFAIDGVTPAINSRILVKNQSSSFQNGIYTLTVVGSGITNWVLTRSLDYDTPAEITPGDLVPVDFGTVNATTFWLETATVVTIGTDPITFTQFFGGGVNTLVSDSGTATASMGSITIAGGANIATSATASTLTVKVSGTTDHAVQVGNSTNSLTSLSVGTNGQLLVGGTAANPSWVTPTAGTGLSITTNSTTLTYAISAPVSIANGGTNATSMATTDGTVYFDGTRLVTTATGTSGWVLTSAGAGVAPAYAAPAASSISITGDTGGALTGAAFIFNGPTNSGKTVVFSGSGSTISLKHTDTNGNSFVGLTSGINYSVGSGNTAFGYLSMGVGVIAANNNVAFGARALQKVTSGAQNCSIGNDTMSLSTVTGSYNTVMGYNALPQSTSGSFNVCLGPNAGLTYTSSESSNIIIGYNNQAVIADANTLRIGLATGTSDGYLNKAYICGIDGINVGSVSKVLTMASNQIGTATITAGTNITVTPTANTITIAATGMGGFTWSVITANQTAAVNNGYICNKAGTLTLALPTTSVVGDVIEITGINTAAGWQITQAASQQVFFGTSSTTAGVTGTLTSSAIRDSIRIVCVVANLTWNVLTSVGNITVV